MAHGTFDSGWGAYAWWVSRKVHGKSTVDLPLVGRLRKILPVPVPVPICRFAGAGAGADWRFAGAVFFLRAQSSSAGRAKILTVPARFADRKTFAG